MYIIQSKVLPPAACKKNFITKIQVNLCCLFHDLAPNLPEFLLLKCLDLAYHHSHFLATTLDFTSFFTMAFLGATPFCGWTVFGLTA